MTKSARQKMAFRSRRILGAGLGLVLGASAALAQFQPDYWEMRAEAERESAEQARALEREQYEAMLAQRSARAHARMAEKGAFSGVTSTVDWQAAHPNVFGSGTGLYTNYNYSITQPRYTFWSGPPTFPPDWLIWQDVAPDDEPLESLFSEYISQQIVQTKCVICHVEGGVSGVGISRLQFSRSTVEDHVELNRAVFENFVATVEEPVDLILNKVQGVAHGGGMQLAAGTADYANLERFLRQLADESSTGSSTVTAENLFEGVTMASPQRTLRRAAILFAGRLPTQTELDAVADGEEATLRSTIRGLMTGDGFHDFLVRASNDRLLTDRQIDQGVLPLDSQEFVALNRKFVEIIRASRSRGFENEWQDPDYRTWEEALTNGLARAPLELIAHVVENDLPYTEILTADYIMANPMAAEAYGATTQYENVNDPFEFRPSEIVSYYRNDESKVTEIDPDFGYLVTNPGNLLTDYPHAGILNNTVFLLRYPTTATNRNRARSRWTYYHFLGVDVEKSASRTTDAAALADTNNPTLHNPACTVCHSVLDPVAGAFQNYGDEGLYRHQWGGLDSLDDQYKEDLRHATFVTVNSRSWEDRDTVSVTKWLEAGRHSVALGNRSRHNIHVDHLTIRDADGDVVSRKELEESTQDECGTTSPGNTFELTDCLLVVPIEVSADGEYEIETQAYVGVDYDEVPGRPATLAIWAPYEMVYHRGDTWYRDMRQPGFGDEIAPNPDNSVQWLAERIVADERFAEAAVKFWWPAILGTEMADPPEGSSDPNFEGRLVAATAQAAEASRLADAFKTGIADGMPYNGKDLLAEIALSPWFRAESVTGEDPVRAAALRDAGMSRLLTPAELTRKTEAVAGYVWGRIYRPTMDPEGSETHSNLHNPLPWRSKYGLLYGGIDSDGITTRATDMTPVMAALAQTHAVEVSCPIVRREFFLREATDRVLFDGIDKLDTPDTLAGAAAIRTKLVDLHQTLLGIVVAADSPDIDEAFNVFSEIWNRHRDGDSHFGEASFQCDNSDFAYYDGLVDDPWDFGEDGDRSSWNFEKINELYDDTDMDDPTRTVRAWVVTLIFFMTDYRYLYF